MQLTSKLYKYVSYIFITFIVLLIIISFGMPTDWMGGDAGQFIAAEVDGRKISRRIVAEEKEVIRNQMRNVPDQFLTSQALERAIEKELFRKVSTEAGLYPVGEKASEVKADFIKTNFASYKTENGFNYEKLRKDLRSRGYQLSNLEKNALRDFAFRKNLQILGDITFGSDFDTLEKLRLSQTIVSYRLIAIDKKSKDAIIKKRSRVTSKEINETFKRDYLSKDKKAKLTKTKREAIISQLQNKKKGAAETEWFKELKAMATNASLESIARKNAVKVFNLKDVPLSQSLDAAKQKSIAASLVALENNETFRTQLFSAPLKKIIGPIRDANAVYLVMITNRKFARLPSARQLVSQKKTLSQWLADAKFSSTQVKNQVKSKHEQVAFNTMFQVLKQQASIKRYQQRR